MEVYSVLSPNLRENAQQHIPSRITTASMKSSITLPDTAKPKNSRPAPYPAHLILRPIDSQPHCLARDRLYKWKLFCSREAVDAVGMPVNLSDQDLDRIQAVLGCAWSESTREVYGSGLLAFHVFCNSKDLPEAQRTPTSPVLVASFLASLAGAYSNKTLQNYVHGIRAWHILYGIPWSINEDKLSTMLKAVEKLAPPDSKRKKR
ncbi:hypothetical protein BYT27DRAFT_7261237 [Phlegmacium glaucopus]|nr:hypothetical protein BYT27DRAFT_7261237 [Phlegmacium glaucopus]